MEGRRLTLGRLDDLAVELAGRGLVEASVETVDPHALEQPKHSCAVDVGGVLGLIEGDRHVGLGREVVDLGRTRL